MCVCVSVFVPVLNIHLIILKRVLLTSVQPRQLTSEVNIDTL